MQKTSLKQSMIIEEITSKTIWDDFVKENKNTFLHSWEWGEFNHELGHNVNRYGIYNEKNIAACFLLLKIVAKRGKFLFIPHGPIVKEKENESLVFDELIPFLKKRVFETNCSFVRISPLLENNNDHQRLFKKYGFIAAPMHMHSELCWVLDLTPDENALLSEMRKTTRYLVKQQEKYGIIVTKSTSMVDFEAFYAIYLETEKRQKFVGFSKEYLRKECSIFVKSGNGAFYFAKHENKPVSSAFIITFGNSGYYHQGATILDDPKIPAAYVLQWEIIKDLKKNNFQLYNFWGISPENKPSHPWYGLSKFKRGFGGHEIEYTHAQDLAIKPAYWTNWIIETLRRIKREY